MSKDELRGNGGSGLLVLRIDETHDSDYDLALNVVQADCIVEFSSAEEYVIILGVSSHHYVEGNDMAVKV